MTDVLMKKSPQDNSESAAHCENSEQRTKFGASRVPEMSCLK